MFNAIHNQHRELVNAKFFKILRDRQSRPLVVYSCSQIHQEQRKGNRLHQDIISKEIRYSLYGNQFGSVVELRAIVSLRLNSAQVYQ